MSALTRSRVLAGARTDQSVLAPVRGRNRAKLPGGIKGGARTLSAIEFCGWLGQAEPGDAIRYHRGFLILDRFPSNKHLSAVERAELDLLADCATRAAKHELVHLVQRRNAPLDFSYLAIARARPKKAPATMAFPMPEAA